MRKLLALFLTLGLLSGVLASSLVDAGDAAGGGVRQKKAEGDTKKKRAEEEEDEKPTKPGKKRTEDEDERPAKSGIGKLNEDAEKQARVASGGLTEAAKRTEHKRVKGLFYKLAVEHDLVTLKSFRGVTIEGNRTGGSVRVKPLPEYVSDPGEQKGSLNYSVIDEEGTVTKEDRASYGNIQSIRYYEQIAVEEVKDFLKEKLSSYNANHPLFLGRYNQLLAAEQALAFAMRFHQAARETEQRKGDAWDAVEAPLRTQLLEVQLEQMTELAEAKSWDAAFALSRRLVDTYNRSGDHKVIAPPLVDLLRKALRDPSFSQERLKEARARLRFLEDQFPNSEVIKPLSESLQSQAANYFDRAKTLWDQGKKAEAKAALTLAEETWPELTGLRGFRIKIDQEYQVLEVGVRALPTYLSPGWAFTDSELRAVELMFESLVSRTPDEQGLSYYRPALAVQPPEVLALAREFTLPRNANWSDGKPLGVSDLRHTVQLLQDGRKLAGRSPAWGDMLDGNVSANKDPFRAKLKLKQGLIEPLAAMSFKLLPQRTGALDPTERPFAQNPTVTSGPFVFAGRKTDLATSRPYVGFEANPYYGVRGNKLNLPRIREIRLYQTTDPVQDLRQKQLDLALDLTAEQAAELRKSPDVAVPLPKATTPNRRIWYLAVNNQRGALGTADVRIALARAINREQLLDDHFRKGLGREVHRALNGPYPAGSWACNPDANMRNRTDNTSLDPFDADLAQAKLRKVLTDGGKKDAKLAFTVKYATGDKAAEEAVKALCGQVAATLPEVTLKPEPRQPHDLRTDVEETHNYDLAYYHHDFIDETLWLMPLLGPSGRKGGEGSLRYAGSLIGKIKSADLKRDFAQVRQDAHVIHREFLEQDMPLIPLWQLDALYGYRREKVEMPPVDAQLMFTRVEEWRVLGGRER